MINKLQDFLQTTYAKANVPDWFDELQSVIQSQQEPEDQLVDAQSENTHKDWIIISDLNALFDNPS